MDFALLLCLCCYDDDDEVFVCVLVRCCWESEWVANECAQCIKG